MAEAAGTPQEPCPVCGGVPSPQGFYCGHTAAERVRGLLDEDWPCDMDPRESPLTGPQG